MKNQLYLVDMDETIWNLSRDVLVVDIAPPGNASDSHVPIHPCCTMGGIQNSLVGNNKRLVLLHNDDEIGFTVRYNYYI